MIFTTTLIMAEMLKKNVSWHYWGIAFLYFFLLVNAQLKAMGRLFKVFILN